MKKYKVITDNFKWIGLNPGMRFFVNPKLSFEQCGYERLLDDCDIVIESFENDSGERVKLHRDIIKYYLEHNPEWFEEIKDTKPNPITSSLDGVGEIIGLSLQIRDIILDMRKSRYTKKDMVSFAEYCMNNGSPENEIRVLIDGGDQALENWKNKMKNVR